ncbi:MAG: hypothetical protein GEU94_06590 [Micromonosporaceae bacterium]|nr:hypothetical protein [Micromonosporaceae bacterium]
MRARLHGQSGRWSPGGIVTYAADDLYREVAYLGRHAHWPLAEVLNLEHADRRRFMREIADLVGRG